MHYDITTGGFERAEAKDKAAIPLNNSTVSQKLGPRGWRETYGFQE